MSAITFRLPIRDIRCYYRPLILVTGALVLLCGFWFFMRYPQLVGKAGHVGQAIPSMTYSYEAFRITVDAPIWQQILYGALNWLDSMKIGMSFGVLLGALLHTALGYYPLKVGKNLYVNSLKGALIGMPMGVCANCAVPTACGVTRGNGRIEVALGFLFSSPNFNPVVIMMTFAALPLAMSLTKYAILLLVILCMVPALIRWLERDKPLETFTAGDGGEACAIDIPKSKCTERFRSVSTELGLEFAKNVWMLVKPTVTIMLLSSVVSAALLVLIPWNDLLSEVTPLRLVFVNLVSVFMPVPIALDVMFASQLHQQGIAGSYVMLFFMTLGTYSIIPTIYLWRDVSKRLAVVLFVFFIAIGWLTSMAF